MTVTELDDLDAIAAGSLGAAFAYRYRIDGKRASVLFDAREQRTLITTGSGYGAARPDVTTPGGPHRIARYLGEVIPRVPTTESLIPYVAEINTASDQASASAVAEGGTKPESPIQFRGGEVSLGKVNAWAEATDELLDDAAGLRAYIDSRLMENLSAAEDVALVAALLAVSGIQSQAFTTNVLTTLANALAKVETAAGGGAALAMHPADYWALLLANPTATAIDATTGTVWGAPVVRTLGVPTGRAIAGAFDTAAVIRDKTTGVKFTDSHSDYFVKGKTVILAERRSVLVPLAPALFVSAVLS